MHSFVQRITHSRRMVWGGLALLGALTLPVSSSFAQEYYQPEYGYGYQGVPAPAPVPQVVVVPPAVEYREDYVRPEWRWRWRHWHRHFAPRHFHHYYRR